MAGGVPRLHDNQSRVGDAQIRKWNGNQVKNPSGGDHIQTGHHDRDGVGFRANQEGNKGGIGGIGRMMCNKCKDTRHATKDCTLGHCAICGKKNHITDECTWLKQMKPVPKFAGYAARGLGVLLAQNSKDVLDVENPNPMPIVTVISGEINET